MTPPAKRPLAPLFRVLIPILLVMALVLALISVFQHFTAPEVLQPVTQIRPSGSNSLQIAKSNSAPVTAANSVLKTYSDFKERPLAVAYESPKYQFTLENGKDTNIIRQLAHNPLEYRRMVDENSRIFQRQLVYLKETAASVFEQAKLTGQAVHELTLPGIDREMEFEIVKSEGNADSSRQGMYSGHLVGNNDSLVTLAFQDGREAFTVLSPKDNLFVVGEPREPGQVIVKAIDPNTYGQGPEEQGDDSIKSAPVKAHPFHANPTPTQL